MKLISGILLLFSITLTQQCFAGLDYNEKNSHRFKYAVKGEINIKPDRAVFPVTVTVNSKSYVKSFEDASKLIAGFKLEIKKLNNKIFSISPSNFFKKRKYKKKFNVSFFGDDDENIAKTRLIAFLIIKFEPNHNFQQRAQFIAESLDFINKFKTQHKNNKKVTIYQEDSFYEINNVERFREEIVSSVYNKAKNMAQIIGKHENITPTIKEVYFDQYINEDIINFNNASLSINAKIEYTFK